MGEGIDISVVIPVFNEEENVGPLYEGLRAELGRLGKRWEILFIDDGSTDRTFEELKSLHARDGAVRAIRFRRNFGQTAALDAGFKAARGEIIVTMDGDLQNNPEDVSLLLAELEKGADCVCGWRHDRKDPRLKRVLSKLAGLLRKIVFGNSIHDSGCTFRSYRRECLEGLHLYADMHRFIPELLRGGGYRIAEVKVRHHRRLHGKSKYNSFRLYRGFLDLLVLKFWSRYSTRPVHLFGGLGLILFLAGFATAFYLSVLKIFFGAPLAERPLLILSVLLMIVGIQFFLFGLLADIVIQIYYDSRQGRPSYWVEEVLG